MCFKFQTCFDTMYLTSINILVTSNIFFELYIQYFNGWKFVVKAILSLKLSKKKLLGGKIFFGISVTITCKDILSLVTKYSLASSSQQTKSFS